MFLVICLVPFHRGYSPNSIYNTDPSSYFCVRYSNFHEEIHGMLHKYLLVHLCFSWLMSSPLFQMLEQKKALNEYHSFPAPTSELFSFVFHMSNCFSPSGSHILTICTCDVVNVCPSIEILPFTRGFFINWVLEALVDQSFLKLDEVFRAFFSLSVLSDMRTISLVNRNWFKSSRLCLLPYCACILILLRIV